MSEPTLIPRVTQLRLVVEAEDFEQAVAFFRDALGLTEAFTLRAKEVLS